MKFLAAAITAALLICGTSAVKAADAIPAPTPLAPMNAGPAGPSCSACASGNCATSSCGAGCCHGDHSGKLLAWMTYWPQRTRLGECHTCCAGCLPPLYLYFVGSCQEHNCATCGCGNGCGGHTCH